MKYLVLLILLFAQTAFTNSDLDLCTFDLKCNHETEFKISLRSMADDCSEDDGVLTFTSNGIEKTIGIPKKWYSFTEDITKEQKSVCKKTDSNNNQNFTAYAADKDSVLLFLKTNNRPFYDQVTVILLNTKTGELIDYKKIGSSKNQFILVIKSGQNFKTRIINDKKQLGKYSNCDCDALFIDDWMQISIKNKKIHTKWVK